MASTKQLTLAGIGLILATACSSDSDGGKATSPQTTADCPVVVSDAACDKTKRPFVFVHGTYGSGDNIAHVASLFGSNGYCQDRFVAVEYDSIVTLTDASAAPIQKIDDAIDAILAKTGADQVELAGHSQGTLHATTYLSDPVHAAKVAHYINLSGETPVQNDVQTLSLSSENDLSGTPHHTSGTNVTKVTFKDQDHFAVAASTDSFVEMWKYLYGEEPKYKDIQCGDAEVELEGISETFADNEVVVGKAKLYELPAEPRGTPVDPIESAADAAGHFGPFKVKRNVAYELQGYDADGKLVGYQYFSPFKRTNRLVRLLVPSHNALVASASTDNFKRTPNQVDVVFRYAPGAFRHDLGDSLTVDGKEILTDENSGRTAAVVGLFAYDANENGTTDLGATFSAPFLAGTDVFIDPKTPKYVEFNMNGTKVKVANWPASDALLNVMFQ